MGSLEFHPYPAVLTYPRILSPWVVSEERQGFNCHPVVAKPSHHDISRMDYLGSKNYLGSSRTIWEARTLHPAQQIQGPPAYSGCQRRPCVRGWISTFTWQWQGGVSPSSAGHYTEVQYTREKMLNFSNW